MKRTLAVALVLSFAMSGCLTWGPVDTWPCKVVDLAFYVAGQNSNKMDEVHVVVDQVELVYAGPDEDSRGNGQSFVKKLDLDLRVDQAKGEMAVFAGEGPVPCGIYDRIFVDFHEAYGIQNGNKVPIELGTYRLEIEHTFHAEEEELRVFLDMKGKVHETSGSFFWKNELHRATFTQVVDAESGSEVHRVGQLVRLPEAAA